MKIFNVLFTGMVIATMYMVATTISSTSNDDTACNMTSDSTTTVTTSPEIKMTGEITSTECIDDVHIYVGQYADLVVNPVNVLYNVTDITTPEPIETSETPCTTTEPITEETTLVTTEMTTTVSPITTTETTTVVSSSRPEIYDCTLSNYLQEYIYNLSNEYGIPYELVMAVIKTESAYQADAYSGNSYGLMQINIINYRYAQNLGVYDLYDPAGNILVGVNLLSELMERHTMSDALICYNVGETAAKDNGLLGGSTNYTDVVLGYYYDYLYN